MLAKIESEVRKKLGIAGPAEKAQAAAAPQQQESNKPIPIGRR